MPYIAFPNGGSAHEPELVCRLTSSFVTVDGERRQQPSCGHVAYQAPPNLIHAP
jgi:hypothetical protein